MNNVFKPICPNCHSHSTKLVFRAPNIHGHVFLTKATFPYYSCPDCFSLFNPAQTNSSFYQKYYPKNFSQISAISSKFLTTIYQPITKYYQNQKIKLVSRYAESNTSILDIGCGTGSFLSSLPCSYQKTGIDINAPTPTSSINFINANFLDYQFNTKYSIITAWHVLEHFHNPHLFLSKVSSLLKPNGIFLFSCPNTESLGYKIGQQNWFHLDSPRHLFIPNSKTLKNLLGYNHFKLEYTSSSKFDYPLDLFWSVNKSPLRFIIYPLYPIFKFFDTETILATARQIS